ncbi:UBX domain-containing protein 8 [Scleropages formosus]|uniref:UBX domain protein 8 n=1 Tax=Scleropages formosus TaxID=113540 RepID=A0A8C9R4V0_SCLFO|nr:UBX domain-containing protein 8 [Scleropages formosus]
MAVSRTVALLGILFLSFLSIVYMKSSYKAGFQDILLLVGRALFLVLLSSWLVSILYPRLRSSSASAPPPRSRNEDEDMKRRQEQARKEQQETLCNKAAAYHESVLMPRQESKLRKKEERFYRMTGEAWKLSPGQLLGEGELVTEHLDDEDLDDTPNVRAMRRRKIPESATRILVQPDPPQEKKVIILPDEPLENDEGVVRVVLRCPSGRTLQRKFLKSHSSLTLLQWMQKIGYPPALYTVCTSYPRRALDTGQDLSLEDAGIDTDTVLNIEEKDTSTA